MVYHGKFMGDLQKSREKCGTCFTSYFAFSSAASYRPYNIIDSYLNGFKIFFKKLPVVNLLILALLLNTLKVNLSEDCIYDIWHNDTNYVIYIDVCLKVPAIFMIFLVDRFLFFIKFTHLQYKIKCSKLSI
jgi:hypothetical protein